MSALSKRNNMSMVSTYMSKDPSLRGSGFFQAEIPSTPIIEYEKQPLSKELPRWNQSAATWRHTSYRYSFSKDKRFREAKTNCTDILQPQLPSTNNNKSCTFGKGDRKPISDIVLRNAKQKPAPNAYDMRNYNQSPINRQKGKTFGIGWKSYEKVYISHRKDVYSGIFTNDFPPAHYQVRETPGKHKRAFSMYGRLKMYTQLMAESTRGTPGPCYMPHDRHLQNTAGLNQRNFGFGQRIDLSAPANDYPGAKYQIHGFCDRFKKSKNKSLPKTNE